MLPLWKTVYDMILLSITKESETYKLSYLQK